MVSRVGPPDTKFVRRFTGHPFGHPLDMVNTTTATSGTTYRGPAGVGSPRLAGVPGVGAVAVQPQQVLETARYDTTDRRLVTAGIRLNLHRGTDAAHWQLLLPDGDDEELLRVPAVVSEVEGVDLDRPPDELDELVRGTRRERPLHPVGRIRTVRVETRLLDDGARPLAVVVHDEVTAATLGRSTTIDTWTEIEIRPLTADAALLTELEARVRATGVRAGGGPAADAVLDRLLSPARPRPRSRAGKKGSAGAVLFDYLGTQIDRIAREDLRVRRDEPDAVHQLRVAVRRLRSAVQTYTSLLDREWTRPLVIELRHLGRTLAPARDTEVLRERIVDGLDHTDPDLVLGPVRAQVTRHFARAEAEAHAATLAEFDGDRYAVLRAALDELLVAPPLTRRAARPAAKELPRSAAKAARRLERAVSALDTDSSDEAVHRVRKAGKRLRYATEVARPAVGGKAKRLNRKLKDLQRALGEHQDTVVARRVLRELGAHAHVAGENGFTFGMLHGRETASAHRVRSELPRLWQSAWRKKNRRWLTP